LRGIDETLHDPWQPGDVVIHNHPYYGASHSPDIAAVSPVYYEGELVGFSANTAHHVDIGAASPGLIIDVPDVFAEGMLFKGVKLYEGGVRNRALWHFMGTNTRVPDQVLGDIEAQVASVELGVKRFVELLDLYGKETVFAATQQLMDYSESMLRKRIAERLVSAQQNAAMLTTFNEVNMKPIMDMRKNYKDAFEKAHGVRLGFMGFFTRACVEALKRFPEVNASIDDDDVVYHGYYDIGMAVSTERGLVVPVVRDADQKGLAEVESQIIDYGQKAQKGKLSIDEMTGGTFTISNGGVFGSLMSMPILNPPQTAILGMHKIQERPMAVDGEVKILPMMYLALSYDHRLIDGKQAVQFLVAVKNFIEDPARLLLDI